MSTSPLVSTVSAITINASSQNITEFVCTSNQTTFSITYVAGAILVFLNGVLLDNGVDYTATNGTSIVLVNGAAAPGGLVRNEIELAEDAALLQDIDTKVIGYFRMAKACIPHMRKNKFGRIINIGGMTGRGTMALSGMRNAALSHFTKTLSDLVGANGITVNIIHPGVIETPHIHELYNMRAERENKTPEDIEEEYIQRTPIRRILEAEEIGFLIVFLSSVQASGITGESIGIDGGISRYISL